MGWASSSSMWESTGRYWSRRKHLFLALCPAQFLPTSAAKEDIGLYEAWRVFKRRLRAMWTRDDRKGQRATRRALEYGLDRLREILHLEPVFQHDPA